MLYIRLVGLFEQRLGIEPTRDYGDKSIRVLNPRTFKWREGEWGRARFETSSVKIQTQKLPFISVFTKFLIILFLDKNPTNDGQDGDYCS